MSNPLWTSDSDTLKEQFSPDLFAWLTRPYILSQKLKEHCSQLRLQRIAEYLEQDAWIRQIALVGDGVAWTYGRVEVPRQTYLKYQAVFDSLGDKPIGETLLYHDPSVTRSNFEYCALNATHALFIEVAQHIPGISTDRMLPARRSTFTLQKIDSLLISEVFLPSLPAYDHQ